MLTAIFNRFELDSLENQKTIQKLQQEFNFNLAAPKIIEFFLKLSLIEQQDNSSLVKNAKLLLKEEGCNLKLAELYETFSKLIGEKNWNVVQGNNISLYDRIFNNLPALPTGIHSLDMNMLGGLRRGELVTVVGETNIGKLSLCINWISNILQATNKKGINRKLKVLHINLQGGDLLSRYQECLNLPKSDTPIERLQIHNKSFNFNEQDLYSFVKETYSSFPFDVLVVHGQLLDSSKKEDRRLELSLVFRSLNSIAQEFNAVVISPVQATRHSQLENPKNILRATDIAESFEIAQLSSVIVTISAGVEPHERILLLEKQRRGPTGQLYLISIDFETCQVQEKL